LQPAFPVFGDINADEFYPAFSADGNDAGLRIWEVGKTATGWGNPMPFDTTVSTGEDYAMTLSSDGTLNFIIRRQHGGVFVPAAVKTKWKMDD